MNHILSGRRGSAILAAGVLSAAGCSQSSTPTAPMQKPSFTVGGATDNTAETGKIKLCKSGNVDGTFNIALAAGNTGTPTFSSPVTVTTGTCKIVVEDAESGIAGDVIITETSAGFQSASAVFIGAGGGPKSEPYIDGSTDLIVNFFHGHVVTYNNFVAPPPPPPPPPGNKGCTPGYWKQSQHFDSWPAPYIPTGVNATKFNAAFGIGNNWFSNSFTLLAGLGANGGGTNALARHAGAALLNAASGFYPLTVNAVIKRVQDTYNGSFGVEATKDYFEGFNTLGCPLN